MAVNLIPLISSVILIAISVDLIYTIIDWQAEALGKSLSCQRPKYSPTNKAQV